MVLTGRIKVGGFGASAAAAAALLVAEVPVALLMATKALEF